MPAKKKKPPALKSRIRSALRRVWLYSPEYRDAKRYYNNTCAECGRKGTAAKGREVKTQLHHIGGMPELPGLIDEIIRVMYPPVEGYEVLCKECHKLLHKKEA